MCDTLFLLESEMIPFIQAGLPSILGFPCSFAHANELPVNNRVVDIAAAPIDQQLLTCSDQVLKILGKLSMVQLDVLSLFVGQRKVSIQRLSKRTFLSPEKLHSDYLDVFDDYGLIERESRYSYVASNWVDVLPPYIVAIEAKLNRWQEALEQARSNKSFANISIVVLSKAQLNITSTLRHAYQNDGIGLLTVTDSGEIETIVLPRRSRVTVIRERDFQMIRILRDLQKKDSKRKWRLMSPEESRLN